MKLLLDLKAIGYGLLAAIGGLIAITVAINVTLNIVLPPPVWLLYALDVLGNLLPATAGLFAARTARSAAIVHGLLAGGVCILLLAVPTVLMGNLDSGVLLSILELMMLVWLGAILGNYWRSRRGA